MELFEKYGMSLVKGRHIYEVDLTKRSWDYECATPVKFIWKTYEIDDGAWKNIVPKIAELFFEHAPIPKEKAVSFAFGWSKQKIFYETDSISNLMPLSNGLWVNCNQTATHSVWEIEDMINLFSLDMSDCRLIIHRPSSAEPQEIKDFFLQRNKSILKDHIKTKYGFDDAKIDKIINNIDYFNKKYLNRFSKSYDNLLLMDSTTTFSNYKDKLIKIVRKERNENNTKLVIRYMVYLTEVYPRFLEDCF